MESGLARLLVAERSPVLRADIMLQIEQKAETDTRIIPGTASATETSAGEIELTAEAYDYSQIINIEVTA
jgi:hypothetical protein